MVEIRIDNTGNGTWYLYNSNEIWKDYIGCENFDEEVVLIGNKDYKECTEASWYQRVKMILDDIDYWDEYPEDLSVETNAKLKELYNKCICTEDIAVDVLKLLYPNDTFETGTIRGYSQSDWQDYIIKGQVDIDLLEAFYFEKVADITVNDGDEEFGDIITHDDLWKVERNGLKEYLRERYEIPKDEDVHILIANEMKQVPDWKEIS